MVTSTTKAYCAYASISEKGTVTGAPGDQTGKELKVSQYYNFGQTYYFRFNESVNAWWLCVIMHRLVNNNLIGYSQNTRTGLFNIVKKNGWKSKNVKSKCNCDCSSLVATAFNCVFEKEYLKADTTTANLASRLKATGQGHLYKIRKDYRPMAGDIIFKPGKHVIVCIGYK